MYQRILILVEDSPQSRHAVAEGVTLAQVHGADVVLFSVLPRYVDPVVDLPMVGGLSPVEFEHEATRNAEQHLAAARAVAERAGVTSKQAVATGLDDAECLTETAAQWGCELIVVGFSGGNAVMRLISGNVIPGLITRSTIPVLVVREPDAATMARRASVGQPPADSAAAVPAAATTPGPSAPGAPP